MASLIYNRYLAGLAAGDYDGSTRGDTIKCALALSGYSPNRDTHLDFADITNEFSDASYTSGGETLGGQDVTQDDTNDQGKFDGNDVTYSSLDGGTADALIMYQSTGTPATSLLMFYIDDGGFPFVASGGDLIVQWAGTGICTYGQGA